MSHYRDGGSYGGHGGGGSGGGDRRPQRDSRDYRGGDNARSYNQTNRDGYRGGNRESNRDGGYRGSGNNRYGGNNNNRDGTNRDGGRGANRGNDRSGNERSGSDRGGNGREVDRGSAAQAPASSSGAADTSAPAALSAFQQAAHRVSSYSVEWTSSLDVDVRALNKARAELKRTRMHPDEPAMMPKAKPIRLLQRSAAAARKAALRGRDHSLVGLRPVRITPRLPLVPRPPRVIDITRDRFTFSTASAGHMRNFTSSGQRFQSASFTLVLSAPKFRAERAFRHALLRMPSDEIGVSRPLMCPIRGHLRAGPNSLAGSAFTATVVDIAAAAGPAAAGLVPAAAIPAAPLRDHMPEFGNGFSAGGAYMPYAAPELISPMSPPGATPAVRLGFKETRYSVARRVRLKNRKLNAANHRMAGVNCVYGMTLPKALISRRAVDRNRVRRRLRAALMATLPQLLSPHVFCDLALMVKPVAAMQSHQGLCLEIRTAVLALLTGTYPGSDASPDAVSAAGNEAGGKGPGDSDAPGSLSTRPCVYVHPFWVASSGGSGASPLDADAANAAVASGPRRHTDSCGFVPLAFPTISPSLRALGLLPCNADASSSGSHMGSSDEGLLPVEPRRGRDIDAVPLLAALQSRPFAGPVTGAGGSLATAAFPPAARGSSAAAQLLQGVFGPRSYRAHLSAPLRDRVWADVGRIAAARVPWYRRGLADACARLAADTTSSSGSGGAPGPQQRQSPMQLEQSQQQWSTPSQSRTVGSGLGAGAGAGIGFLAAPVVSVAQRGFAAAYNGGNSGGNYGGRGGGPDVGRNSDGHSGRSGDSYNRNNSGNGNRNDGGLPNRSSRNGSDFANTAYAASSSSSSSSQLTSHTARVYPPTLHPFYRPMGSLRPAERLAAASFSPGLKNLPHGAGLDLSAPAPDARFALASALAAAGFADALVPPLPPALPDGSRGGPAWRENSPDADAAEVLRAIEAEALALGLDAAIAAVGEALPRDAVVDLTRRHSGAPTTDSTAGRDAEAVFSLRLEPGEDAVIAAGATRGVLPGGVMASAITGGGARSWIILPSALEPSPRHCWSYSAVDAAFDAARARPFARVELAEKKAAADAAAAAATATDAAGNVSGGAHGMRPKRRAKASADGAALYMEPSATVVAAPLCPGSSVSWVIAADVPPAGAVAAPAVETPLTAENAVLAAVSLPTRFMIPAPSTAGLFSTGLAGSGPASRLLGATHAPLRARLGLRPAPTLRDYLTPLPANARPFPVHAPLGRAPDRGFSAFAAAAAARAAQGLPTVRVPAPSGAVFEVRSQSLVQLLPADALARAARGLRVSASLTPVAVQCSSSSSSLGQLLVNRGAFTQPLPLSGAPSVAAVLREPLVGPAGSALPLPDRTYVSAMLREFLAVPLASSHGAALLDVASAAVAPAALRVRRRRTPWLMVGPTVVRDANRAVSTGVGSGGVDKAAYAPEWVTWQGTQPRSPVELQARLPASGVPAGSASGTRVSSVPVAVPPRSLFPHALMMMDRAAPALPAAAGGPHACRGAPGSAEADDNHGALATTTAAIAMWGAIPSATYPGFADVHNDPMFVPELGGGVAPNPHFAAVRANAIATMDHLTSDSTTPTHGSSTRSLRFAPPSTVADAFAAAMPPLPAFPTTSDVLASATAEAAAAAAAAKIATESALSADLDSDQYDVDLGPSAIGDTDLPWNSASNTSVADRAARRRASPPHIGIVHTLPLLASDQITGLFNPRSLHYAQALYHLCLARVDSRTQKALSHRIIDSRTAEDAAASYRHRRRWRGPARLSGRPFASSGCSYSDIAELLSQEPTAALEAADWSPLLSTLSQLEQLYSATLTSSSLSKMVTGQLQVSIGTPADGRNDGDFSGPGLSNALMSSAAASPNAKRLMLNAMLYALGETPLSRRAGGAVWTDPRTSARTLRAGSGLPRIVSRQHRRQAAAARAAAAAEAAGEDVATGGQDRRQGAGYVSSVRLPVRVLLRTLIEAEDLLLLPEIVPLFRRICLTGTVPAGLV